MTRMESSIKKLDDYTKWSSFWELNWTVENFPFYRKLGTSIISKNRLFPFQAKFSLFSEAILTIYPSLNDRNLEVDQNYCYESFNKARFHKISQNFTKSHSTYTSNFLFINRLKTLWCATNWDSLLLATLWYLIFGYNFFSLGCQISVKIS